MKKTTNEELHRPSAEEYARMRKMPVTVVLDNIRSLNNVGSFFRTCDAFAVERLLLCGITGTPPSREIHKTALGAEIPSHGNTSRVRPKPSNRSGGRDTSRSP